MADYATVADGRYDQYRQNAATYIPYVSPDERVPMTNIRKSEGGSGGGRGHSNMTHWDKTAQVKDQARKDRRANDKALCKEGN